MPLRRQVTRRFLATVLFTDIVGSTERAAELGDRAWRDLLERHHAVVRRELKAFHGREIDTAGDGFFALFEAPERAVRCAESIIAAVGSLGLQVRAGVHTGECEVIGGGVGGMAVHIGARVAALAGPGEVLVTGSVRDLMTGSDRHFDGGEPRQLKGVADRWPVYRLVPEPVDGDAVASRAPSLLPLYTRRQRRRLVAGLAGVLVVALAVTGFYLLTRSPAEVVVGENEVGVIGPGGNSRVTAAVKVGQRPTAVATGFGSVWVTNSADGTVSRIDPHSKVAVPIPVGASPSGVAVGLGAVWVANSGDSTVSRIDPATARETTTISVGAGASGIVVAAGAVWVASALTGSVSRIDPATSTVTDRVTVGGGPTGIAFGAGSLWVTDQADGTVTRIDPQTPEAEAPIRVGTGPAGVAVGRDAVWVANNGDGSLSRIDLDDESVTSRTLAVGAGSYGVAIRGSTVFVSNEFTGTVDQVDGNTFRLVTRVHTNGAPLGLALDGDTLWFANAGGGAALHRGGVLTVAATRLLCCSLPPDPKAIDPGASYDPLLWSVLAMTNDGLVGLRRDGGARGALLVPDLATAVPEPTDGGLTYTFRLRPGVRWSTGAPVRGEDVRRGIERTMELANTVPGGSSSHYYLPIAGAPRCRQSPAHCDLAAGIAIGDGGHTVTFHLTHPEPDFLYLLALPPAFAVPVGTPAPLSSVAPAATGPYLVESYLPARAGTGERTLGHGRLELVRNPRFREWSAAAQPDGYPDRIVFDIGMTDAEAVRRVEDGRADVVWNDVPPELARELNTRYPSQSHTTPGLFTSFLFLGTTTPPFDNRDARRAVAFALNRGALASDDKGAFGDGRVACQVLPPTLAGYDPYCPFTSGDKTTGEWTGPDLHEAQRLVAASGTRGAHVVVRTPPGEPAVLVTDRRIADLLRSLGYRASVRETPGAYFSFILQRRHHVQAGVTGWGPDYPAVGNFIRGLVTCEFHSRSFFNLAFFCDRHVDALVKRADATLDPATATALWREIDHAVVDDAAMVPISLTFRRDFVSRRVHNFQAHPEFLLLPAQMWVQ